MKLCPACNSQIQDNQEVPELVPLGYHEDALALSIKRRIAAEEKLRWIPVSERLPIENGKYLIYVSEHTTEDSVQREEITSAIWSDKKWYYGHSWIPRQKPVTHWMPLPEPPQEVE